MSNGVFMGISTIFRNSGRKSSYCSLDSCTQGIVIFHQGSCILPYISGQKLISKSDLGRKQRAQKYIDTRHQQGKNIIHQSSLATFSLYRPIFLFQDETLFSEQSLGSLEKNSHGGWAGEAESGNWLEVGTNTFFILLEQ